ncbi:MAG: FAD-binding oxidoreductase [Porticoccaceae bacterium]
MSLIAQIEKIVGNNGLLQGEAVTSRPNQSMGQGSCPAIAIVRPASTEELSAVMKLCHANQQPVVAMGGLTGLVNGTTCSSEHLAISLERMRIIESIDEVAGTMTVQAGVVLETAQNAVKEKGWQLAMDWGARGTAQIGGALATNAGGNSVVRYGMAREQVLGLEAVLADGTVVTSLNEMLKNNTGYDLKQLFIGSEGTLGIITRAVLRLRPACDAVQTAVVAVDDFAHVGQILRHLGSTFEGKLSSFEVMWSSLTDLLTEETGRHQKLFDEHHPYSILIESSGVDQEREAEQFERVLGELLENELASDVIIAQSSQHAAQFWEMRDDIEGLMTALHPIVAFDVSLPIRDMDAYTRAVTARLKEIQPGGRSVVFGHLGDSNIHIAFGPTSDKAAVEEVIYSELAPFNGAISAEHGIGLDKRAYLHHSRSATEIALMKTIKAALDPLNLLNPDKIFL